MEIVRFSHLDENQSRIGCLKGSTIYQIDAGSIAELLKMSVAEMQNTCADTNGSVCERSEVTLHAPIDGRTEVWAAGVTYERSQTERMKESGAPNFYEQVYEASRPELFFKSVAWRVAGLGQSIAVRADSHIDVPEPELALVLNSRAEICGYSICNDVSSRTIEGENPLYLPQAKVYLGACAMGPGIRPAWEIEDPNSLGIALTISRDSDVVWSGSATTADLHREFSDLIEHLYRADIFPDGAILSTGTSIVPDLPFSLAEGDVVRIDIDEIGVLINTVVRGLPDWASSAAQDK